jgi:hypothetical protein
MYTILQTISGMKQLWISTEKSPYRRFTDSSEVACYGG